MQVTDPPKFDTCGLPKLKIHQLSGAQLLGKNVTDLKLMTFQKKVAPLGTGSIRGKCTNYRKTYKTVKSDPKNENNTFWSILKLF